MISIVAVRGTARYGQCPIEITSTFQGENIRLKVRITPDSFAALEKLLVQGMSRTHEKVLDLLSHVAGLPEEISEVLEEMEVAASWQIVFFFEGQTSPPLILEKSFSEQFERFSSGA